MRSLSPFTGYGSYGVGLLSSIFGDFFSGLFGNVDNSGRGSWANEVTRHNNDKPRDITNDGFTLETFEKSIESDEYTDFRW